MTPKLQRGGVWRNPAAIIVLLGVFLGAIDLTVVATILPRMITDLGINAADLDRYVWVINGYLIAYVVSIPLFGRISDILGVRAAFMTASVIFVIGSFWCATAESLQDLVVGRVIQGVGGGALLPIALSVATSTFSGASRAQAIGAVGAIDTLGWVSGPAYGAVVASQLGGVDEPWRYIFWINIPLTLFLMVASWRAFGAVNPSQLPPERRFGKARRLDLPGFVLLAIFLTAANLALTSGGEIGAAAGRGLRAFGGTPNPVADYIPTLTATAIAAIILLALWTLRSPDPLVPRSLLRFPSYRTSLISNFLLGTVLMTGMVNVPVIVSLIETSTDTATISALLLAPFTATIAVFSIVSARLLARFGARIVTLVGLVVATLGNIAVYPILELLHYEWMAIGLAVAGVGIGLALTPLSSNALEQADPANRGSAASTLLVFRLLGMTVGVSALTSLGVQRLQVLTATLEPVTRAPEESTAEFLLRQQRYVIDQAIPLGEQVVQETFLVAALLVALALIPVWMTRDTLRLHRSAS